MTDKTSRNDITGVLITTARHKPNSAYEEGWDRIFNKQKENLAETLESEQPEENSEQI